MNYQEADFTPKTGSKGFFFLVIEALSPEILAGREIAPWEVCPEQAAPFINRSVSDATRRAYNKTVAGYFRFAESNHPAEVTPEVLAYSAFSDVSFYVFREPACAKWCPTPRLALGEVDIQVDCDVFLLDVPSEILTLLDHPQSWDFMVLQEVNGAPWQRGCFADRVAADMPYINAGLFVQTTDSDITCGLNREFKWWQTNVEGRSEAFHDVQGGLTASLLQSFQSGRLYLLPKDRYRLVIPRSNPDLLTLAGTVLLHATYPIHPAYEKFKTEIHRAAFGDVRGS